MLEMHLEKEVTASRTVQWYQTFSENNVALLSPDFDHTFAVMHVSSSERILSVDIGVSKQSRPKAALRSARCAQTRLLDA